MKKVIFFIIGISCAILSHNSFAQWTSPTGPYTYTTDQVGIGTATPGQQLELYHMSVPPTLRLYYNEEYTNIWDISNNFNLELKFGNSPSALNTKFIFTETGRLGIGTTAPSYLLQANGDIYANGGWFRVAGASGLYFQTYGGGFNMTDNTWIRTYGSKSFLHSSGIMRTDGTFQVGPNGGRFVVNTTGKVGIGTTSMVGKMNIYSSGSIGSGAQLDWTKASLYINQDNVYKLGFDGNQISASHDLFIVAEGEPGRISLQSKHNGTLATRLLVLGDKVGIGTTNPQSTLSVNGEILCEKIRVINDVPASDFVFEPDYNLKSLSEVEEFIKNNKHLPEIPSAAEFKEKGYSLGEMDDLLLRKIEEQMLYIIELNKKIEQLERIINTNK